MRPDLIQFVNRAVLRWLQPPTQEDESLDHFPAGIDAKVPNPERGVDAEAKAGGPDASGLVSGHMGRQVRGKQTSSAFTRQLYVRHPAETETAVIAAEIVGREVEKSCGRTLTIASNHGRTSATAPPLGEDPRVPLAMLRW